MTRLRVVLLAGILYLVIGLGTAALARQSGARWRLAAWVISAAVFATHIAYEHFRLHSPPRRTALSAALAVALGAFGLAVAATIHAVAAASYRANFAVALVAWPLLTAVPAYAVALAAAAGLSLARPVDEA